jgi:nucleoside-diphosphate-sugar epimerase
VNEHERFLATRMRRIPGLPDMGWLEGKRILVTGGTGCIGSRLTRELSKHHPAALASFSMRPGLSPWPKTEGVSYLQGDIRHYGTLMDAMREGWDIVFHTAAQRDPGLAERHVAETVTTNVFGSLNVIRTAEITGAGCLVFASTGKALRPFSPDTYTASKRIAEWLLAGSLVPLSGCARFTHVVDNSIFYGRLARWCHYGQPIALHSRDAVFYLQSATEAAELLMGAAASAREDQAEVHAITDLGMPAALLDLAEGCRAAMASDSPIVVTGYASGYEEKPFPGLYDPLTAGEVSPLLNAFEAAVARQPYPGAGAAPLDFGAAEIRLKSLERACWPMAGCPDPCGIKAAMHEVSWAIMRAAVAAAPLETVRRVAALCKQYEPLPWPHDEMLAIIAGTAGNGRHEPTSLEAENDRPRR